MSQENCFDGQDMRSGTGMRSGFEQALSHLADLVILLLKLRKLSAVVENTPNCAKLCARLVAIFSLSGLLISEFLVVLIIAEWSLINCCNGQWWLSGDQQAGDDDDYAIRDVVNVPRSRSFIF